MLTVVLPWPDPGLSPNARLHWAVKAKKVKASRWVAFGRVTFRSEGAIMVPAPKGLSVAYTFHPGTKRRRDLDNLIASTKAYTDGIAQALAVDDSTFRLSYAMGELTRPAKVVVEIT